MQENTSLVVRTAYSVLRKKRNTQYALRNTKISKIIDLIKEQVKDFEIPSVTQFAARKDPYLVLVSCILSLRTKDKTTISSSKKLFNVAKTPKAMVRLSKKRLEKLIYPVGFFRNKAKEILEFSRKIITEFKGKVPNNIEDLLQFKGVGKKTANLVLGLGFGIPAICVDTHVHRISNRLGLVKTIKPEDTEEELKNIIPKSYWIELNTDFVSFGQNICVPVSPFCSKCKINRYCNKIGVTLKR